MINIFLEDGVMNNIKITTVHDNNAAGPLFDPAEEHPILGLSLCACCCCSCCEACCCCVV
jgi:hypothetical protein